MKKIFSDIRSGLVQWIVVLVVFWTGVSLYAAIGSSWTSPSSYEATSSTVLSSASWNNILADIANLDARVSSSSVPTGTVIAYNGTSCPSGWTKAAGSGVPTGSGGSSTLDLRGEFIRGLDDGRWVDSGRVFASTQADDLKAHNHKSVSAGILSHRVGITGGPNDAWFADGWDGWYVTSTTGGSETRPRNIALVYCVKN